MRDKYNLNTMLPSERDVDDIAGGNRDGMESEGVMIPGMAPEDRVEVIPGKNLALVTVVLIGWHESFFAGNQNNRQNLVPFMPTEDVLTHRV